MAREKKSKKTKKAVGWSPVHRTFDKDAVGKTVYLRKGKSAQYDPIRDAKRKSKSLPETVAKVRFQGGYLVVSGQPYAGDNKKVYLIVHGKNKKVAVRALFATRKEAEDYIKKYLKPKHPQAFRVVEGWI